MRNQSNRKPARPGDPFPQIVPQIKSSKEGSTAFSSPCCKTFVAPTAVCVLPLPLCQIERELVYKPLYTFRVFVSVPRCQRLLSFFEVFCFVLFFPLRDQGGKASINCMKLLLRIVGSFGTSYIKKYHFNLKEQEKSKLH